MIGETIYLHDSNHRVYKDDNGAKTGYPNPRHMFRPATVTGETKQSWLVQFDGRELKVSKATLAIKYLGPGISPQAYTQQQMEDALWFETNRMRIIGAVRDCRDIDVLRRVAALLLG